MDLRGYLRAIRASWWIILLCLVLGLVGAVVRIARTAPTYAGHVTFYVGSPTPTGANSVSSNLTAAEDLAVSYAQLLSSDRLARLVVAREPSLNLSAGAVASRISGSASLNTVLVTATVQDSSKVRLRKITRAVAEQFPEMVQTINSSSPQAPLEVTSGPSVDAAPVAPRKSLLWGLGLLAGLVVGLIIAVVRELLSTSVRTEQRLAEMTGAPVLGALPNDADVLTEPVLTVDSLLSVRAEAFRKLRTSIEFIDVNGLLDVLVVTSPSQSDGKSVLAANLALMFAETGRSVLLVEADLRRPRAADLLGMEGGVGLTDVLIGHAELEDVVQPWGETTLSLLPSGSIPPNPAELLGSGKMTQVMRTLRDQYHLIVLDSPPLLPVADAGVLAARADGVVLVARYGRTRIGQLREARRILDSVHAHVVGVVLNRVPIRGDFAERYDAYRDYTDERGGDDTGSTSGLRALPARAWGRLRAIVTRQPAGPVARHRPASAARPVKHYEQTALERSSAPVRASTADIGVDKRSSGNGKRSERNRGSNGGRSSHPYPNSAASSRNRAPQSADRQANGRGSGRQAGRQSGERPADGAPGGRAQHLSRWRDADG